MVTNAKSGIFTGCGRPSGRQILWAAALGAALPIVLAMLRKLELPTIVRYVLPLIPLAAGGQYMRVLVRDIREQKDELQLRIYLEAAIVVVCGLVILMLVYPALEAAGWVGKLDSFGVQMMIIALGLVGYFTASRRYR
jgi:uncharacterized membrane protein